MDRQLHWCGLGGGDSAQCMPDYSLTMTSDYTAYWMIKAICREKPDELESIVAFGRGAANNAEQVAKEGFLPFFVGIGDHPLRGMCHPVWICTSG